MFKKLRHATNQFAVDQIVPQNRIVELPGSRIPLDCQYSCFSERHRITQPSNVVKTGEFLDPPKPGRRRFIRPARKGHLRPSKNRVADMSRPRCAVGCARQRACGRALPATKPHPNYCGFRRGSVEQCNSSPVYSLRPGTAKAEVDVAGRRAVVAAIGRAEGAGVVVDAAANDPGRAANRTGRV